MNRVNRNKISIIIFCIAVISIPVFITISWRGHNTIYLFIASFVMGYVITELIKFKKSINKFEINDIVAFVLSMLIPTIIQLIPFNNHPFGEQINRLYFPKDSIDIEREIKLSNQEPQKFIFAFDNSGEGLREKIDKNLSNQFQSYCNEIECSKLLSWAENEKQQIKIFRANDTYGNLLKARLCYDLILVSNKEGEFCILKIGDPNVGFNFGNFKSTEQVNIKKAIKSIINTKNDELFTNFNEFYAEIENIKNKYKDITLNTYSDYYQDCKGTIIEKEIENVKKSHQIITKDIVCNCFIDNHKTNRNGKYFLDSHPNFPNEKFFFIDSISDLEEITQRIVPSINEYWFYSKDEKKDLETEYCLKFSQVEKQICSYNENQTKSKDKKIFYINGEEIDYGRIISIGKYNSKVTLRYEGKKTPNEETLFEITQNNIHYFIYFSFIKEWGKELRWILPILFFFFGILIGMIPMKKLLIK